MALVLLVASIPQTGAELFQPQSSTTLFEGPYARLRHPQALAVILVWLAIPLLTDSLTQFLVAIIAVCGIVCLIFKEEKDLVLRFGDLYVYYRHLVPCFFPILRPEWNLRKEMSKLMDRYTRYLDRYNHSAEHLIREQIASGALTEADGQEQLQRLTHSPFPRTITGSPVRLSSSPRPFECPRSALSFDSAAAAFVAQHRTLSIGAATTPGRCATPPHSPHHLPSSRVPRRSHPPAPPQLLVPHPSPSLAAHFSSPPQLVLHRFDHAIVETERLFQPKDRSKAPFHPLLVVEIQGEAKDGQYVCKKFSRGYPHAMVCTPFVLLSGYSLACADTVLPA
jgi:hypothetical protein